MNGFLKKYLYGIIFAAVLVSFTTYALLDTFVIPQEYQEDVQKNDFLIFATAAPTEKPDSENRYEDSSESDSGGNSDSSAENTPVNSPVDEGNQKADDKNTQAPIETEKPVESDSDAPTREKPIITENSYDDGNIKITITQTTYCETEVYVADVTVSSAEYLRTALAKGKYGRNICEKTSEMAEDNGGIFAVNGDYYGSRTVGYVIRNGVLCRSKGDSEREDLVIYANGTFDIVSEAEVSAEKLLSNGAYHVLSFGPGLVDAGELVVSKNASVDKEMESNPRCAIGVYDPLHYVFVVSDGRTDESAGLSLYELGQFIQSLEVNTAYNLDGGGSATMYFNGRIINKPTTFGDEISERSISDIVYIGY